MFYHLIEVFLPEVFIQYYSDSLIRKEKEKEKPGNKYRYNIDFSAVLKKAKDYFLRRPDQKPVDVIRLLCRFIHAVKEEYRQFARPLRGIGAIHFNYR